MPSDLLSAALAFAAGGMPVFPCQRRDKNPLVQHGFKDATVDTEQIRAWWSKWPLANVGIPTGAASGIVVLDIDPGGERALAALTEGHGPLPETRAVRTGRGRQLWFEHPGVPVRCSAGVLGDGLNLRGDGGYVIAPPSIHPNGKRYTFANDSEPASMPSWLVGLVTAKAEAGANAGPNAGDKIRKGKRNARLAAIAGALRRQGLPESEILETLREINLRQCDPPLADVEVRAGLGIGCGRRLGFAGILRRHRAEAGALGVAAEDTRRQAEPA
jgi:Bifunctional DNA primase/polymerase, N-terminal/Primase C terminal 1 (PriCT-1)